MNGFTIKIISKNMMGNIRTEVLVRGKRLRDLRRDLYDDAIKTNAFH